MWFDPSMDEPYQKAVSQGIQDAGYEPLRIDKKNHNNKIDDQIIAEIKRSRFIVADFTHGEGGMRGGVYYEAGFAHGLNIPVIFTCRKDVVKKIHLDTRQYNHILWEADKLDEFKKALSERISAIIGDGPTT
jgi:nucleoside 2-deoxyribosyltransferase